MHYRIEAADLHAHLYGVTLTIAQPAANQRVSLPVWIAGSYMVREFGRHLSALSATQGRAARDVQQLDKTTWQVHCSGSAALVLQYEVYAYDTSVRTAFLSADRGFFNNTSLCLRVHGRESGAHHLSLVGLPRGWDVATAMTSRKASGRGLHYEAADYDELVDHPFELGPFWRGRFKAQGVEHEFVVAGAWPGFDGQRLLRDSQRICEEHIRFWHGARGKPPFQKYVFMLHAVDDSYGGLEHRASTALIAARKDLPRVGEGGLGDGYLTLLGLISHEYFHTWNVKRLKPAELCRIDHTKENYTELLWFFEGFTSYFDDLALVRCGLIDGARYAVAYVDIAGGFELDVVAACVIGGIATLVFDRPQVRNAMSWAMYEQLEDACRQLAGDPSVRVACLRGAGPDAEPAGGWRFWVAYEQEMERRKAARRLRIGRGRGFQLGGRHGQRLAGGGWHQGGGQPGGGAIGVGSVELVAHKVPAGAHGGHGGGADQQAPLPVFEGAGLDRSEQGAWQQLADGLQTATGSFHPVNQPRQGRRLSGRLQKRYGGVAAWCCGHGRRIIPQPRPGRARSVGSRPPCR